MQASTQAAQPPAQSAVPNEPGEAVPAALHSAGTSSNDVSPFNDPPASSSGNNAEPAMQEEPASDISDFVSNQYIADAEREIEGVMPLAGHETELSSLSPSIEEVTPSVTNTSDQQVGSTNEAAAQEADNAPVTTSRSSDQASPARDQSALGESADPQPIMNDEKMSTPTPGESPAPLEGVGKLLKEESGNASVADGTTSPMQINAASSEHSVSQEDRTDINNNNNCAPVQEEQPNAPTKESNAPSPVPLQQQVDTPAPAPSLADDNVSALAPNVKDDSEVPTPAPAESDAKSPAPTPLEDSDAQASIPVPADSDAQAPILLAPNGNDAPAPVTAALPQQQSDAPADSDDLAPAPADDNNAPASAPVIPQQQSSAPEVSGTTAPAPAPAPTMDSDAPAPASSPALAPAPSFEVNDASPARVPTPSTSDAPTPDPSQQQSDISASNPEPAVIAISDESGAPEPPPQQQSDISADSDTPVPAPVPPQQQSGVPPMESASTIASDDVEKPLENSLASTTGMNAPDNKAVKEKSAGYPDLPKGSPTNDPSATSQRVESSSSPPPANNKNNNNVDRSRTRSDDEERASAAIAASKPAPFLSMSPPPTIPSAVESPDQGNNNVANSRGVVPPEFQTISEVPPAANVSEPSTVADMSGLEAAASVSVSAQQQPSTTTPSPTSPKRQASVVPPAAAAPAAAQSKALPTSLPSPKPEENSGRHFMSNESTPTSQHVQKELHFQQQQVVNLKKKMMMQRRKMSTNIPLKEFRTKVKNGLKIAREAFSIKEKMSSAQAQLQAQESDKNARHELHEEIERLTDGYEERVEALENFDTDDILDTISAAQRENDDDGVLEILQATLSTSDLKDLSMKLALLLLDKNRNTDAAKLSISLLQEALSSGSISELQTMAHEVESAINNLTAQMGTTHGNVGDLERRKATLTTQKKVLENAVKHVGGWRAAVFLENGDVDYECDFTVWPVDDKVNILSTIKDHLTLLLEEERDKFVKHKKDMRAKLKAAGKNSEERKKQAMLHKKIRKLWKTVRDSTLVGSTEGGAREAFLDEKEGEHNVLDDFNAAKEHEIFEALDRDHSHIEQLNGIIDFLERSQSELEAMSSKAKSLEDENKSLRDAAKDYVDPSIMNELEELRREVEKREKLVSDLQLVIGDKEAELKEHQHEFAALKGKLGEDLAESEATKKLNEKRMASDLEQLEAMKKSLAASEQMAAMMKERVAELEVQEKQFTERINGLLRKERDYVDELEALAEARKADEFALEELERQLSMALDGDSKLRLEALKRRRQKKLKGYSSMIDDIRRKREENFLAVMKSYKWIHHVPQVVFNGVPYSSLVEWAEKKRAEMFRAAAEGGGRKKEEEEKRAKELRFLDMLHLEGKAFEELKKKEEQRRQYFGGGGVFFVTTDIPHLDKVVSLPGRRSRARSLDGSASVQDDSSIDSAGFGSYGPGGNSAHTYVTGATGSTSISVASGQGPLVQFRHSADIDKQPYGPWGRHPQLRYPYSDPSEPGGGNIAVDSTLNGEESQDHVPANLKLRDGENFHWSKSFEKGRLAGAAKIPVRRVQHTWLAKRKDFRGGGAVKLPELSSKEKKAQNTDPFTGMKGFKPGSRDATTPGGNNRRRPSDVGGWSRPGTTGPTSNSGGALWEQDLSLGSGKEVEAAVVKNKMPGLKSRGGLSLKG